MGVCVFVGGGSVYVGGLSVRVCVYGGGGGDLVQYIACDMIIYHY